MISIIVAMDDDQLIGKNDSFNGMPWNNKEDLNHFKETTIHQTILYNLVNIHLFQYSNYIILSYFINSVYSSRTSFGSPIFFTTPSCIHITSSHNSFNVDIL